MNLAPLEIRQLSANWCNQFHSRFDINLGSEFNNFTPIKFANHIPMLMNGIGTLQTLTAFVEYICAKSRILHEIIPTRGLMDVLYNKPNVADKSLTIMQQFEKYADFLYAAPLVDNFYTTIVLMCSDCVMITFDVINQCNREFGIINFITRILPSVSLLSTSYTMWRKLKCSISVQEILLQYVPAQSTLTQVLHDSDLIQDIKRHFAFIILSRFKTKWYHHALPYRQLKASLKSADVLKHAYAHQVWFIGCMMMQGELSYDIRRIVWSYLFALK